MNKCKDNSNYFRKLLEKFHKKLPFFILLGCR